MIKPVPCIEFIASPEAIARRGKHRTEQPEVLKLDVYNSDRLSRPPLRDGGPVYHTGKDFDLSVLFLPNVGQLLSRGHICERVWGRSALRSHTRSHHSKDVMYQCANETRLSPVADSATMTITKNRPVPEA
jgi:DNA-binding response OmpR family regulator